MSLLDRIAVVLVETQDVVNIGGVVRAMMNTGLTDLRLVRPVEFDPYRIEGIAHRSGDLLERARFFDTLADALAGCVFTVGTSSRGRTASRLYGRPREDAPALLEWAQEGTVALVFGREDHGLSNEDLDLCQSTLMIPTAGMRSLNLAQAVLIIAYELMLASGEGERPLPRGRRSTAPAAHEDLEEMYGALREGLERVEFFKARKPESVMRTLRTILSQARMDRREARLVAGIGYEMRNYLDRHLGSRAPDGTSATSVESISREDGEDPDR